MENEIMKCYTEYKKFNAKELNKIWFRAINNMSHQYVYQSGNLRISNALGHQARYLDKKIEYLESLVTRYEQRLRWFHAHTH